jgi:hypothetical protein
MRQRYFFSLFMLSVLLAGAAFSMPSVAQTPVAPIRVRGVISAIEADTLVVSTKDGSTVKVTLSVGVSISTVKAINISAIKPGSFIGTAAAPGADGGLQSLEVVVFPEEMRGTGEGHRDWDLTPGSSMTNATVDAVVESANGRNLQLSYKGGSLKISVPPSAPIVTFVPADRSDLKVGAPIFTSAIKAADGSLTVARVVVGKDGLAPPM